jgi:hypothetical protein
MRFVRGSGEMVGKRPSQENVGETETTTTETEGKEATEKIQIEEIGRPAKDMEKEEYQYAEQEEQRKRKFYDIVAKLHDPEYREYTQSLLNYGVVADCVKYGRSTLNVYLEQWDGTLA